MVRKEYESVSEATDLAGIRAITFIESGAAAAAKLLRGCFKVHPEKSLDKAEELGDSQVGYRSIHLICELERERAALPEYKPFKGLLFEIQVRTVLQHAWAEIDYDRGYKFSGVLPSELRRRLNLLAGQLEFADKEFSRLAEDVDLHSAELQRKKKAGDLDIELSSASIGEFLTILASRNALPLKESAPAKFAAVIDELHGFGIDRLQELSEIMSSQFLDEFKKVTSERTTQVGLLRRAMMYADIDKYFSQAWTGAWRELAPASRELIRSKWGNQKLESVQRMLSARRKN